MRCEELKCGITVTEYQSAHAAMAGSTEHAAWLERQLQRSQLNAVGAEPPSPAARPLPPWEAPTPVSRAVVTQPQSPQQQPQLTRPDYAAGSISHARWLERQLLQRPVCQPMAVPSVPPPQQPDTRLPPGVNALLRGQDLSAKSHGEWLELQLAPRRVDHTGSRQLASHAVTPVAARARSNALWTSAVEDIALGSSSHRTWLDRQLTPRR